MRSAEGVAAVDVEPQHLAEARREHLRLAAAQAVADEDEQLAVIVELQLTGGVRASVLVELEDASLGARIDGDAVLRDPELAQHVDVVEGRRGALAWALGVERKDASVPLVVGMEHESEEAALVVTCLIELHDAVAHVEERLGSGGVVLADLDDDAGLVDDDRSSRRVGRPSHRSRQPVDDEFKRTCASAPAGAAELGVADVGGASIRVQRLSPRSTGLAWSRGLRRSWSSQRRTSSHPSRRHRSRRHMRSRRESAPSQPSLRSVE
ncbi:MAG: hypothetical protein WKF45_01855 [Ilumatobacteraceae bacterium]